MGSRKRRFANKLIIFSLIHVLLSASALGQNVPGRPGRPRPTPVETPTPPPPDTTPTPVGTPDNSEAIARARARGLADGKAAGAAEGRETGAREGAASGYSAGERAGYDICERQMRQEAYDLGYRRGTYDGENEGLSRGEREGRTEGERRGESEGRTDGTNRADNDSHAAAQEPGRRQGYQEANQSDADVKGDREGTVAGDSQAASDALNYDYPAGRKNIRTAKYAEPIDNNDTFSQLPTLIQNVVQSLRSTLRQSLSPRSPLARNSLLASHESDSFTPPVFLASDEETQAYNEGYREGYAIGRRSTYQDAYDYAYREGEARGHRAGCTRARNQNYNQYERQGYREGYDRAYDEAYRRAYDAAYRPAYNYAFRNASDTAYRDNYDSFYRRHFENARAAAYRERYQEIYNRAFAKAKKKKYDEVYPGYAAVQYRRGQTDETQDFVDRPVRLLDAEIQETLPNDILEPGEKLRLKIKMRNFNTSLISKDRVRVVVSSMDTSNAVIYKSAEFIVKDLRSRSVTSVTEALEFILTESAVKEATSIVVGVEINGRSGGTKILRPVADYQLVTSLAEDLNLREGLEGVVKIKVTNQSQGPTPQGAVLELLGQENVLDVVSPAETLPVLAAGESKIVEVTVIPRRPETGGTLPLRVSVAIADGRRVGLLNTDPNAPYRNEYFVKITNRSGDLQAPGVVRLTYKISDISSSPSLRALQLKVRVISQNPEDFSIVGPNPQYLRPMRPGTTQEFIIPVLVKSVNAGGKIELVLNEDGRTTVIHRLRF